VSMNLVPGTPSRRSISRCSNASSRPWSPITSSVSTNSIPPLPDILSRARTPSLGAAPRPRPRTPSHIPAPAIPWRSRQPGDGGEDLTTLMQRAFSLPNTSPSTHTSSGIRLPPPRPPSRSMMPLPSVHVSSESRSSTAMSFYPSESPLTPGTRFRAQTPESALGVKAQRIPFYTDAGNSTVRASARQVAAGKLPPSSFRDSSTTRTPNSRPGSRTGAYTPVDRDPLHLYTVRPGER
jgi:hypothetical protein